MEEPTTAPEPDLAGLLALMPFAAGIGVVLEAARPEQVTGRLAWSAERCTAGGVLHGGALMTLADSVGALCAHLNLPEGSATSTVSSSASFLRAVRGGQARAVARPLHVGRSFMVVVTDIDDDAGRLVAQVTATQAVLAAPRE